MNTRTNSSTMSPRNGALTARSVLLSVLLGSDPPSLPVQLLVSTTELFGIAPGTTRTALSRMVAAGEVGNDAGVYYLTGAHLLARQSRQKMSRAGSTRNWDGTWIQAIVAPDGSRPAADRARLRAAFRDARMSELREGVWLRPANLDGLERPDIADVVWFSALSSPSDSALARRLWDLDEWGSTATTLIASMARLLPALERGDRTALADGFVLSASVLRQFQADPLLPPELVDAAWPGDLLRRSYERYDAAYRTVLGEWFRSQPR